ncbi:MAG TPA: helix-turn-helix transcriptional regulator [Chroococcidiopsis sp.]
MDLGSVVKEYRIRKGYSQRKLAEETGINFTYVSKIENNNADYAPSESVLKSLAAALEVDSDFLIALSGRLSGQVEMFIKENRENVSKLLIKMAENPAFAKKIFDNIN